MTAIPKPAKSIQDEARLDFVRKMPCLISEYAPEASAHECDCSSHYILGSWHGFGCEAHHVRKGAHAGAGRKPPANRTVPLCTAAHSEYHATGHDSFCLKYGLDLEAHLRRINAEFAKRNPKPKIQRAPAVKIGLGVKSCPACHGNHFYPLKQLNGQLTGFRCKVKNQWVSIEKVSA